VVVADEAVLLSADVSLTPNQATAAFRNLSERVEFHYGLRLSHSRIVDYSDSIQEIIQIVLDTRDH
jgi:hypothetical protein